MDNTVNQDIKKISTKSIIMLILAIIAVITVGTFAWLTYRSNDTAMVLTIGEIDGMTVTLKPYQINTSLVPTNDYSTQEYVNVSANNKKTEGEKFRLYYQVDSIDSALINNSFKFIIQIIKNLIQFIVINQCQIFCFTFLLIIIIKKKITIFKFIPRSSFTSISSQTF